jgi:hypothetical protein
VNSCPAWGARFARRRLRRRAYPIGQRRISGWWFRGLGREASRYSAQQEAQGKPAYGTSVEPECGAIAAAQSRDSAGGVCGVGTATRPRPCWSTTKQWILISGASGRRSRCGQHERRGCSSCCRRRSGCRHRRPGATRGRNRRRYSTPTNRTTTLWGRRPRQNRGSMQGAAAQVVA